MTNAEPAVSANVLDRYTAQDLGFYKAVRLGDGAVLRPQPVSLEAALDESTATVLATPIGVRAGRLIHDLQFVDVELRIAEVLHGALRPELKGVVQVEFPVAFLPAPVQPAVDQMSSHLPKNPAVWLLRWDGKPPATRKPGVPAEDPTVDKTKYKLVHTNCGVFTQGEKGVVAATAQSGEGHEPTSGAQSEAQSLPKLSDLVTLVRKK
ncbi:hypothetical protein [Micromonospora sp. NPDC049204]|uniref:hypothetical protein n=1 Tax=unclassified Micromonospora TaxID=2617518 RepID=UPI003405C4A4